MALPSGIFTMVKWFLSHLGSLPIGRLLGRSEIERLLNWDILMETCLVFFPHSLGFPLVQEFWSSIAREFFVSLSSRGPIRQSWDRSGDLEFSHDLDWEIVRATGILIGRPWQRRVWFGWSRLGFVFWELYWSGDRSGDRDFNREIRSSIDRGFSGISTSWEISWGIDSEDRARQGISIGGLDFGVRLGGRRNKNRHNC